MATTRSAWGIDIGNRALKAIKLVRDGNDLRIEDFEVIEHEHVLSSAGDNLDALIQTALANFVQRHDVRGLPVAVGVSGQQSFARFIKLPPVEPKKIPEIVRFEAIQQIPFPLDDVEWSYQLFETPDSPDVEVGIFAMRKELVNRHLSFFREADLNVQLVQMNPLAVYNALHYDGRIRGTSLIIDMGAENTDLIIADENSVWLRSIPIGGNNFTEALVKAFKLNFAKAEELKRNAATSKYARQIFQAMRPVFADLVAEVQRSIGFYSSVHRDTRIRRIIALGGTFRLPGLQKYIQQNLQIEVTRLERLGTGSPDEARSASLFNENLLSLTSAYGLAVQATGEGKISSSLLPRHIKRMRMWQEKTRWFATAAAVFVLAAAIPFGRYYAESARFDSERARQARNDISTVQRQAQELDQEWGRIEQAGAADRQRITNVKSLENHRTIWGRLIADIHAAVPQPQEPVRQGLARADASLIQRVPRGERELVLIDNIATEYVADIQPILDLDDHTFSQLVAGATGVRRTMVAPTGPYRSMEYDDEDWSAFTGEPQFTEAADTTRGYLITIRGITPNHRGYDYIEETLIRNLRALDQASANPERRYYVARATLQGAHMIRQDTARMQSIRSNFEALRRQQTQPGLGTAGGGGMNWGRRDYREFDDGSYEDRGGFGSGWRAGSGWGAGARPAAPGAERPDEEEPYRDRLVPDETVLDDWQFTAIFAVVIDPPPAAQTQDSEEFAAN